MARSCMRFASAVALLLPLLLAAASARPMARQLSTENHDCLCYMLFAPVCDPTTNTTYTNDCFANCSNVPASRTVPGACPTSTSSPSPSTSPSPAPLPSHSCICYLLYAPVCDLATHTTYGNACLAACANVTGNSTVPGECPSGSPSPSGGSASSRGHSPPPCICTREYRPVCDTLTGKTYSNVCTARCSSITGVRLVPGECSSKAKKCASSCPRTSNNVSSYDPVCVITRTTLGTREATTTSYFNPCIAQCYAHQSRVLGIYKGECNATADTQCANATRTGMQLCSASSAAEWPNQCYAQLLDPAGARVSLYGGQCTQREAVQIAGRCPPTNPIAPEPFTNCLVDPCQFAPHCPTPNATCVSRYCPGFFRNTFLSGICQALWIDTAGNLDTACTFGNATSPTSNGRSPAPSPSPLPCCPPVARPGDGPCTDCGLRGKL